MSNRNAIIIHGMPSEQEYFKSTRPSPSNSHWLPWLQGQLLVNNILAQTPEMPKPYTPVYSDWKNTIEHFDINENTTLVGHSCGAGFILRFISENKIKVDKIVLVGPWLDPNDETGGFMKFNFDLNGKVRTIDVFYSTDDGDDVAWSVSQIRKEIPSVKIHEFSDKGHFTFGAMKTDKFPELLQGSHRDL